MDFEILKQAAELERRGQAFALATVVWRQGPSSSQQGARAIITAEGELHGWIGGACAEPVVIREAQRVIADGTPRLLLLGSPDQFGAAIPDGITVVPISCQSEGALEVYVEPVVAAPHLVIVGRSPMAHTLADLARALNWRTDLVAGEDFTAAGAGPGSMVIVATPRRRGARVSRGPGPARRPARPGARPGRAGPRPHHASGDRRRDPRGAGPAPRIRSPGGGGRGGPRQESHGGPRQEHHGSRPRGHVRP
jgi:xanthine/CO dehydrogenase XdhC/CoxF family maturation factor